jgi:tetratricopeptide (TPR) repeat protein
MGKLTCLVLVGVGLVAGIAHADSKLDEAKSHLQAGAALYDENNFRGALVEFQRAYELAPSYKILFNIAQVELELQDYAGALKAYNRYIKEGGPDVPAARLAQVNADLERIKARVGYLSIQTASGAQVLVDDTQVGYAPLPESVPVAAGQHRVTVVVPGREPVTRMFDVAGRQEVTAALGGDGAVASQVKPPPTVSVVAVPAGPRSRTPIYVAWSVTGALAIGAGVFAVIAHSDANQLASLRGSYPVTREQLDAQRSKTVRNAAISDAFTGATLVSAGIAAYLTLTRRGDARPTQEKAVQLEIAPTGVAIAGRF